MEKLKIALVCHKISQGGGVANYVDSLKNSLLNCPQIKSVYVIETTHNDKARRVIAYINSLLSVIFLSLSGRIDVFHIHMSSRGSSLRKIILSSACLILRKPYIIHIHSGEYPDFYSSELNLIGKYIVRFFLKRASSVIVLGKTWERWFSENLNLNNLAVVYNGIPDISNNHDIKKTKERIVFAGRLSAKKGIYDLISAFNTIGKKRPTCELVIIGSGIDTSTLKSKLDEPVKHLVRFEGWLTPSKCHEIISKCSLLVLPSYYEGLPICILEAMCLSKPVVATNVGAIPEVIIDNLNGKIFTPGDIPSLVKSIIFILENPAASISMGINAREKYKTNFEISENKNKILSLYEASIKNASEPKTNV